MFTGWERSALSASLHAMTVVWLGLGSLAFQALQLWAEVVECLHEDFSDFHVHSELADVDLGDDWKEAGRVAEWFVADVRRELVVLPPAETRRAPQMRTQYSIDGVQLPTEVSLGERGQPEEPSNAIGTRVAIRQASGHLQAIDSTSVGVDHNRERVGVCDERWLVHERTFCL